MVARINEQKKKKKHNSVGKYKNVSLSFVFDVEVGVLHQAGNNSMKDFTEH